MRKRNGCYQYSGYLAYRVMAELHQKLWPEAGQIDGGSRRAGHIFKALSKAYTDGIEDAAQMGDVELQKTAQTHQRSSRFPMSNESKPKFTQEFQDAIDRCEVLLDATARFMAANPIAAEYTVLYDGAQCDGGCLEYDCRVALDELEAAMAKARGETTE